MSSMALAFPNLPELLRQQEIIKNLQNAPQFGATAPGAAVPIGQQTQTPAAQVPGDQPIQAPPQGPQPQPSNPAQTAYQQALQQKGPQISDYHPSMGRRIAGGILGGLAGMHDAKTGMAVGHGIAYSPFDKQMADYQGNLGRLKEAASSEQIGEVKGAQEQELIARRHAEEARAEAEGSKRRQIELEIEHPERRYKPGAPQLFNLKMKDGTNQIGVYDAVSKKFTGPDGEEIDKDKFSEATAYKPGTEKDDKQQLVKETGEIVDLNKGTAKKVATPIPPKAAVETPEQKNKEWDRRNAVQFQQKLQTARVQLANSLKRQQAANTLPTASTRSTAEFAKTVTELKPGIVEEVDSLKDKIGPGEGRWNDFWVNKAGANDPAFAGLDMDLKMYATAIVRVHFGLRGGQSVVHDLQKMFSEAQSPDDLKARIEHADKWVESYSKMAGANKDTKTPQAAAPALVPTKRYNKDTGKLEDVKQ